MSNGNLQGIASIGWYVPTYRLARQDIGAALRIDSGAGERAVACFDEDTTTMAVEAARRARRGDLSPHSLWFATTRPTYLEKSNASVVAAALGLEHGAAFDVGGAVRSGMAALWAAASAREPALALLSDLRYGLPGSIDDLSGADAAVAVAFGDDPVAEVLGTVSLTAEVLERWRPEGSVGPSAWDARWGGEVLAGLLGEGLAALRQRTGMPLTEVDHLVVTSPSPRASRMARLDISAQRVVTDANVRFGTAGVAQVGLLLADALAASEPGQTVLVLQAADGVDALLLRTTDRVREVTTTPLAPRSDTQRVDYTTYLSWRGVLEREPVKRPPVEPPASPAALRNERWKYSFTGSRCTACATVHLPPARVCMSCRAVDQSEDVTMQDDVAEVRTFTIDRIAASPSPPTVVGVLDFDTGGRYRCQITDVAADAVAIGDRMEMTFRVISVAPNGVRNYFWKARPARREV